MASIFMRIDGLTDVKGAATVEDIGGKKGFFAINSMNWSAARSVSVNIGNANNADTGTISSNPISISRASDGASPYLTTFLFAPGKDGRTIEIVLTKPDRGGEGVVPYLIVTLEGARVADYAVSGFDGGLPDESFSLVYTSVSQVYYYEDQDGTISKGDTVKFDCPTAKLVSKANL